MRRGTRTVAASLLALGLLAGACGGEGSDGDRPAADADPVEAAARDAELTFGIAGGWTSFDPHTTRFFSNDQIYIRPVYDRLFTIGADEDGHATLVPQLATSYEYAEDGLSVTFTLREGVTFHDGTPFDADAVVANLERALGPDSTVASQLPYVESVEAVDDTTAVVHLTQPDPALPWELANNTTGYMVSPAAFDTDLATDPVGTGPFQVVSAQRDGEVVYERWDDHWDPDAALVERLTISTIADQTARYNGLRSGQLDAAYLAAPLDAESRSLESEGYHWDQALGSVTLGVLLNSDVPPFDDVRVRRAVSLAVNRTEISETILNGIYPPVYQPFAPGFFGHDPDLDEDPHDVEAARALVEEAGADGAEVELIQPTTAPQDALAEAIQQILGDIGLEVTLVPLSPTEARPEWRTGGYAAMVAPITGQAQPNQTLAASYLAADNPATPPAELVEMADAAAAEPVDSPEQERAYQEISAWLVENPIHVPLVQFSSVIVSRPQVVGSDTLVTTTVGELDFRRVGLAG